jgi:hypothetical protein
MGGSALISELAVIHLIPALWNPEDQQPGLRWSESSTKVNEYDDLESPFEPIGRLLYFIVYLTSVCPLRLPYFACQEKKYRSTARG